MIITPLHNWLLTRHRPAFYDTESVTSLEASSKLYGKMNELIKDYNDFIVKSVESFNEFTNGSKEEFEIFETALRQEFQDFIDTVTLKLAGYDGTTEDFDAYIAVECKNYLNAAIASGALKVEAVYNEETESLDYVLSGEVE